ncbi:hypothetical protein E2C01_092861 [Portunus trituberculatus]|uniref:Uncharacterized protein n=1 Tax=Portunus trituberculatus TaxID=210409 RepID=A0A5B7JN94_PORTR|nr:hypothetical protein [Portunus trituberculatus]
MLTNARGAHWRRVRSAVSPAFTKTRTRRLYPLLLQRAKHLIHMVHPAHHDSPTLIPAATPAREGSTASITGNADLEDTAYVMTTTVRDKNASTTARTASATDFTQKVSQDSDHITTPTHALQGHTGTDTDTPRTQNSHTDTHTLPPHTQHTQYTRAHNTDAVKRKPDTRKHATQTHIDTHSSSPARRNTITDERERNERKTSECLEGKDGIEVSFLIRFSSLSLSLSLSL